MPVLVERIAKCPATTENDDVCDPCNDDLAALCRMYTGCAEVRTHEHPDYFEDEPPSPGGTPKRTQSMRI